MCKFSAYHYNHYWMSEVQQFSRLSSKCEHHHPLASVLISCDKGARITPCQHHHHAKSIGNVQRIFNSMTSGHYQKKGFKYLCWPHHVHPIRNVPRIFIFLTTELIIQREHSDAKDDATGKGSSAMLRSPHLAEAVSLAALFASHMCFNLTVHGTLNKTRPTGNVYKCKHNKRRKAKEEMFSRKLRLIMMCHHDAIMSLKDCSTSTHLSLHCYVLCAQSQSFAYSMIGYNLTQT